MGCVTDIASCGGYSRGRDSRADEALPAGTADGLNPQLAVQRLEAALERELEPAELAFAAELNGSVVIVSLEDTYFRFTSRTDDQLRAALDSYDVGEVRAYMRPSTRSSSPRSPT